MTVLVLVDVEFHTLCVSLLRTHLWLTPNGDLFQLRNKNRKSGFEMKHQYGRMNAGLCFLGVRGWASCPKAA
jgi:hypothetical protein